MANTTETRRPEGPGNVAVEAALRRLLGELYAELHRHAGAVPPIGLESSLERDLALDSLARIEASARIEAAFGVTLPEAAIAGAETVRDLLAAILRARGASDQAVQLGRAERLATIESAPDSVATLVDVLEWHASRHPEHTHVRFYDTGRSITYAELAGRAAALAGGLAASGLEQGQPAAIMLPTGEEFFYSFYGILLAGGVPVPIYPPFRPAQIEDHLRRQAGILANAGAAFLITVAEAKRVATVLRAQVGTLKHVVTPEELAAPGAHAPRPRLASRDLAFLQYTSGSTGTPKGVVLSHANLLANLRAMGRVVNASSSDVFVSWLPLYHDMGLIGACLGSLYYGYPLVLMSPLAFLTRPQRWLAAIHEHRGTLSAAPNFAYALCLARITDKSIEGLDLSSWRLAFNGAEMVSPETLERFAERFSSYGLRREAIAPVYGLAESSLGLAFPPLGRGSLIDAIQRAPFTREGLALPAADGEPHPLRFVGCGQPLPGHDIRVVDASGCELPERLQGRLEFRGPSATSGYYRNPAATRELMRGEWLDSGDYAYVAGGEIYLTGRAKDIVIRAGRNIYPQELEDAVGALPGIRKGCVAVFGVSDPEAGTERLVVMAETKESDPAEHEALRRRTNELALDALGEPVDDVVLVPAHTVLKTSSGKIRRSACRELYVRGALTPQTAPLAWQLARLAFEGLAARARRALGRTLEAAFAARAWAAVALLACTALAALMLPIRLAARQRCAHALARLLFPLAGIELSVKGAERLSPGARGIYVANHASYLDGLLLVAVLPPGAAFVVKAELAAAPLAGWLLNRLGMRFVERFDAARGIENTRSLERAALDGVPLAFFPEGTFRRRAGLLPFRLGAFQIAAKAGVPVIPLTISGTRSVLAGGSWQPHRHPLRVHVGAPILPGTGRTWSEAIRLRDAARAEMLAHCGEPDAADALREGAFSR